MNNFPNKKDRIIVLALWFIFFITAVSFDLFLLAFQDIGTILAAIISSLGSIFLFILIKKVSKGYFLKYYFNKKEFNKMFNKIMEKYKGADEEFIKDFKRRALFQYYTSGQIFYKQTLEDDKWILSDKDNLTGLILLVNLLDNTIKNRSGFVSFIDNAFKLTHNGDLIIKTLENGFLSGELKYLLYRVYLETDFNLNDNGLSDEYTTKINELKEKIERIYTPLLYNFEDEVISIKEKLAKVDINTIIDTNTNNNLS